MKKKNPFYHDHMADMIVCNSCDKGFETYDEHGDYYPDDVIEKMKKDFVHDVNCPWYTKND